MSGVIADLPSAYHGKRINEAVFEELLGRLALQEASCFESLPEHFVGDHVSRQLTSRTGHTVITIPTNCNVDGSAFNFPKAVGKFLTKKVDAEFDDSPNIGDLIFAVRKSKVETELLEKVFRDFEDFEKVGSSVLTRTGHYFKERLESISAHPADIYIQDLEKQYACCDRMCSDLEKVVGTSDPPPSFSIAPSLIATNAFLTRYFNVGALLEAKRELQIISESREKTKGSTAVELTTTNRVVNEKQLLKDFERDHNMMIDQLYEDISEVLPKVIDVSTMDVETTKTLSQLRDEMAQVTDRAALLRNQTKSGVAALNALTIKVESQVGDLKQILAVL